jgi:urease accessory protein
MRQVGEKISAGTPTRTLTLAFDERRKSRQRVVLDDGSEAALILPRGSVLADLDLLRADDGVVILVRAAPETVSRVRAENGLLLARAAYHLGNRHVPLQIAAGVLQYQHDHVLDGMVRTLGLEVEVVTAPFQPEGGAYAGHSHGRGDPHPTSPGRAEDGHDLRLSADWRPRR